MKVQYRIKNDLIGLRWEIFRKYEIEEDFNNPDIIEESIVLQARHRQVKGVVINIPFKFEGNNVIKIDILAKDQEYTGSYDLFLQYQVMEDNEIRTFTVDKPFAFDLVNTTIDIPEDKVVYEGILKAYEGLSAYEVALKNGFEGTESEWLDSLSGGETSYVIDKPFLAFKSELPTKVSELINDEEYLTEHQSLEGYATEDYVNEGIANIDFSDYVTRDETSQFITEHQNISHLARKNELPKKVSELENDSGFLTKHQSLQEYAKKSELFSKNYDELNNKPNLDIYLTEHQDISHLASKDEIPSLESLISKDEVQADYVPKTLEIAGNRLNNNISVWELKDSIGEASISDNGLLSAEDKVRLNTLAELLNDEDGEFVDTLREILDVFSQYPEGVDIMEKFAEKVDQEVLDAVEATVVDLDERMENVANKEDLDDYALKEHTHSEYLTEHQSLTDYAKTVDLPTKVSDLENDEGFITTLSANTFEGSNVELINLFGSYQVNEANNSVEYTVTDKVIGGWAKIKINCDSEPVVLDAVLVEGSDFEADTDMYLLIGYNGVDVEYYFISI